MFRAPAKNVIPIAAPIVTAYDVEPGYYQSYIVASDSANLRKPTVAINSRSSHSGYSAAVNWLQQEGIEDYNICETGAHALSVQELSAGRADLAAVDALS